MTEEEFYATIKLISGEEIFCKTSYSEEGDRILLIISNPIIVEEIKDKLDTIHGYRLTPWLKTTIEDMFIVNLDKVITISESSDKEMISMYESYLEKIDKIKSNRANISKKMGYLSSVEEAKDTLENLFNNS
ncbi:hypothetical protein EBS02_01595 [bacterium]|nr:hypothetical protein [bacterium]